MPIEEHLPPGPELSQAERKELALIERAASQSTAMRAFEVFMAAVIPVMCMAAYAYVLQQAPRMGLTLCKLHGTLYLPVDGAFDRLLRFPMGILFVTAVLWPTAIFHLQSQRRLLHHLLIRRLANHP